jgi:hypothetical protein
MKREYINRTASRSSTTTGDALLLHPSLAVLCLFSRAGWRLPHHILPFPGRTKV